MTRHSGCHCTPNRKPGPSWRNASTNPSGATASTFNPGGLLAGIAGAPSARVNSLHGQGVARLGKGLKVEAVAPDGLVEAFRHEGAGFLLGVQWHPEWRVTENQFYLGIFKAFGDACRTRAAQRKH